MGLFSWIIGIKGESKAVCYLQDKGYKILAKNYSNKFGEIDIIAQDKKQIVFVEVKTRSSKRYGIPAESVNFEKQQKIRKTALSYLQKKRKLEEQCRFDVISILGKELTHIENAFY